MRVDPLTRRSTRILDFPIREILRPDVRAQVESSRSWCPFCPELKDQVTPKFHPDLLSRERYIIGEAMCVPNVFPYDENGAVCIMCREHYLPLTAFTSGLIRDSLQCCFEYLVDVVVRQPEWSTSPSTGTTCRSPGGRSYTPPADHCLKLFHELLYGNGSGVGEVQGESRAGLLADLREEEARIDERCIAVTGNMTWLVDFAPLGVFDVLGVFHEAVGPEGIGSGALEDLVTGMIHVLRYIDSLNMGSLNMSLYFLMRDRLFTPHVRICPRVSIPPYDASQINYMKMLHNESLTTLKPEAICDELKVYWHD